MRILSLGVAMAATASLLTPPAVAAPSPAITWEACGETMAGDPLECARIAVPLDYRMPEGPTTHLALTRLKLPTASDTVVFINGGGPGVSGGPLIRGPFSPVPRAVAERFTVVAIDPRGLPESTPLECVTARDVKRVTQAITSAPSGPRVIRRSFEAMHALGPTCTSSNDILARHISSVANAHDMDIVRRALGQDDLHYIGVSYGTYLGAVYTHLFPDSVGRITLGSVVHPDRTWIQLQRIQVRGFEDTLDEWAATCARRTSCPFRQGNPTDRLVTLIDRLNARPAQTEFFDYSGQTLVLNLRDTAFSGGNFTDMDATVRNAQRLARGSGGTGVRAAHSLGMLEALTGVQWATRCNDWPDAPAGFAQWKVLRADWNQRYPVFGAALSPLAAPCTNWPGAPRRPLDLTQTTNTVPLLVAGLHDPATPLAGARAMQRTYADARLVTWSGRGHGALESRDCDSIVTAYMVDGTLPRPGATCPTR